MLGTSAAPAWARDVPGDVETWAKNQLRVESVRAYHERRDYLQTLAHRGVIASAEDTEAAQAARVSEALHSAWEAERVALADEAARIEGRAAAGLVSIQTRGQRAKKAGKSAVRRASLGPGNKRMREAERAEAERRGLHVLDADNLSARVSKLRRAVGFAARCHLGAATAAGFRNPVPLMLTLTYKDGADWQPSQVKELLRKVRRYCAEKGWPCRYVWVAELQKRGVIHYHIALILPRGARIPMPDKNGWWPWGYTNIEEARCCVAYLMKYLTKGGSKGNLYRLPQGARMYGVGGLDEACRGARRWLSWPAWAKQAFDSRQRVQRAAGGGWHTPLGWVPAEFALRRIGRTFCAEKVRAIRSDLLPGAWAGVPDGAFSWLPGCGPVVA